MEMLAEEMRVLYVALTRAKEKLYLVSSVKSADKKLNKWLQASEHKDWLLSEYDRASANSYLDWIGPALVRHRECEALRGEVPVDPLVPGDILEHPSCWNITIIKSEEAAVLPEEANEGETDLLKLVYEGKTVPAESAYKDKVEEQLSWKYSFKQAAQARSKQSVSEVKRQREIFLKKTAVLN